MAARAAALLTALALALPPVLEPHLDLTRGDVQVLAQLLSGLYVWKLVAREDALQHVERVWVNVPPRRG